MVKKFDKNEMDPLDLLVDGRLMETGTCCKEKRRGDKNI